MIMSYQNDSNRNPREKNPQLSPDLIFFLIWLCANLVTPLCRNWIQYELVLLIYILNRLKNYIHIVMLHLESWRKIHDRCQYASAKYSYCRDVKKRYFKCQLTLDDFIFQLKELYVLLNENYVEDDDNMFRYWFVIRKKEKKIMNIIFFSFIISKFVLSNQTAGNFFKCISSTIMAWAIWFWISSLNLID